MYIFQLKLFNIRDNCLLFLILQAFMVFMMHELDHRKNLLPKRTVIQSCSTVFGKHCECIAHKCAHLERLPPLASHLLLPSHCVLTRHGGKKIVCTSLCVMSGFRTSITLHQVSCIYQVDCSQS